MQMVKNIFFAFLVLWFAILLFMPKQEIYYTLEKALYEQGIEINEKSKEEGIFSFTLHDAKIYVKGIHLATVKELDFFTLLFYSKVTVDTLTLDASLKSMAPENADKILAMHSILSPMKVFLTATGSFGLAEGAADGNSRSLRIDLVDPQKIESLKSFLKKDEKGWYYETSF